MSHALMKEIARFDKAIWKHADRYNELLTKARAHFPNLIKVPREDIWLHNDLPVEEFPHLVNDIVLGQAYIDACLILEIDWTKHQRWCPKHLRDYMIGDVRLGDLWQDAKNQVAQYHYEYGFIDDEAKKLRPRRARIGDAVQTIRRSSPGFKYHDDTFVPDGGFVEDLELNQPNEDRMDSPYRAHGFTQRNMDGTPDEMRVLSGDDNIPMSMQRYDGDARWEQMSRVQQDLIYEYDQVDNFDYKRKDDKSYVPPADGPVRQGVWMNPYQAKALGVVFGDNDIIWDYKTVKTGIGTRSKPVPRIWVTKQDVRY